MGLSLGTLGCSRSEDCSDPERVLVEGDDPLTCAEAQKAADYLELLAARPLPSADEGRVLRGVKVLYAADPDATRAWLGQIDEAGRELEQLYGLRGAEKRATRVWEANAEQGVVRPEHGDVWEIQDEALSIWAKDDEEKLALTEADMEGWIHYASLNREVQGGGVLRISVADRVTVYKMLQDRFHGGDRDRQVAMAAIGPYWSQVRDAWKAAPYETQQAWMKQAPLPPPMTSTSLGYAEAVFTGDVEQHAKVLHEVLGPFGQVQGERAFTGAAAGG